MPKTDGTIIKRQVSDISKHLIEYLVIEVVQDVRLCEVGRANR